MIAQARKKKITPLDRFAYALATGFGAGLVPIAPGTVGAAEGVAIYVLIVALHLGTTTSISLFVATNVIVFAVGVWASSRACKMTGLKDPRLAVIDEVSGQLIAFTPLALWQWFSVPAVIIGFLLFRVFDIFKPYPIRKLELLPSGLGVMADDVLAGIYAAVLLWLGHQLRLI